MKKRPMNHLPKLSFELETEADFHAELKMLSHDYLIKKKDHRFANSALLIKNFSALFLGFACYVVSLMQNNVWLFGLFYCLFMVLIMFVNLNAQHDACHNVFLRSNKANRILGRIITLPFGIDPDYWRIRHVDYHHIYPNIKDYDLDIEENSIFRQSPFQKWFPHMKYQSFYWPLIAGLSLLYIAWVFDWSDRFNKTPLAEKKALSGWRGWSLFLGSKMLHFILMIIVPIFILSKHEISWIAVIAIYLAAQMFVSLITVLLLLGTHWATPNFYEAPKEGKMSHGWYYYQFTTSCDWNPKPDIFNHLFGGINLHLTHHLFPSWSHRHYPALRLIVEQLSIKYNLPYHCLTYTEIMKQQRIFIKEMGKDPSLPNDSKE